VESLDAGASFEDGGEASPKIEGEIGIGKIISYFFPHSFLRFLSFT